MKHIKSLSVVAIVAAIVVLVSGAEQAPSTSDRARVYDAAQEVCPVLVGTTVPNVTLQEVNGNTLQLMDRVSQKPTVLIFYRGGWCVYCNRQLGQLKEIEQEILDAGFQIIAVSPDRMAEVKKTYDQHELNYTLLSDSTASAATAFGIAFRVDQPTLDRLAGYNIDLNAASGHDHHILPVPSVFVLDKKGTILFEYVNPVYSTRLNPAVLLSAVKAAAADSE